MSAGAALAQSHAEEEIDHNPPKGVTPEEIIQRFTAKEKEWKQAREHYTFQQSIKVKQLNGEDVVGEYEQVSEISYQGGAPVKKILLKPQPTLQLSPEDSQDLESRATFTISTDELPDYKVDYVGQQKVDELHCYVFEVSPKQMDAGRRYFQGRIWIDDRDLQIVKNTGKSVPDIHYYKKKKLVENLFPKFTTWREQVDGKYWFPTFSSADDTLHFNAGDVRIKEVLKFKNYKKSAGQ